MATARHDNNFDALRLLGAVLVLASHQFALSGRDEPALLGQKLGTFGVLIFFVISGFLVAASWTSDPDVRRFAARRLLRVWPALVVCVLCCILFVVLVLVPPEGRSAIPDIVAFLLPNLVFVWHDAMFFQSNASPMINGTLWTIPIEVQCYVALALLGLLARARLRIALLGVAAACLVLGLLAIQPSEALDAHPFFQQHDALHLPLFFLAGAVIFATPVLQGARAAALAVVVGAGCAWAGFPGIAWVVAVPPLVLLVGRASWPVARRATRWGDASYGMYLWGWPVQQTVVMVMGAKSPVALQFAATLVIVVSLALCSWHLVEKRCLRWKPRTRRAGGVEPVVADPALAQR